MINEYKNISMADMEKYLQFLAQAEVHASDYSFGNIWGWATHYELEWRFDAHLCWVRQQRPEPVYWAPVGNWSVVENWLDMPEMVSGAKFIRVPEALGQLWKMKLGERVHLEEDRDMWDYLYLSSELCTLSGNRFHKKKNQLNQFLKNYDYDYRPLGVHCVETVLNMQEEWCRWHDCEDSESLLAENDAVARVLTKWNEIPGLCGGIIRVAGVPVAYTLAEKLTSDTLVTHFEKGQSNIKGVYQAINYLFSNDIGKNYTFINREQDLGTPGLRHAKMGYNPVDFVKKYIVTVI